ncbi:MULTISPECIES: hypothetical protein [Nitrosomonas]|uniref:Uncharacterized protein n=1 Tax=Nitrosomonas communis TaxID=44574 RepID=A0A5D3YAC7_9PROT|nr:MULTISPECIES: hypothetical protein [Nitrosomonas]TYP78325.1 hypothetical protein BCL69_10765 [Nitrosomonas communis]UVS60292.1 hypothetical protein NX761_12310 [Nitrosomonas sp. PLL12]
MVYPEFSIGDRRDTSDVPKHRLLSAELLQCLDADEKHLPRYRRSRPFGSSFPKVIINLQGDLANGPRIQSDWNVSDTLRNSWVDLGMTIALFVGGYEDYLVAEAIG